ncbi:MAG: hypothetical protein U5P41_14240 [Gammaproteobacteria bacterium]|nr:hypothetical protein [Gammaproteobacteria bacterium]
MTKLNVGVFTYPKVTMLDAHALDQIFLMSSKCSNTFLFAKTTDPGFGFPVPF